MFWIKYQFMSNYFMNQSNCQGPACRDIDTTNAARYTLCMKSSALSAVIFDFGGVLGLPQDPEREAAMAALCAAPTLKEFRAHYWPCRLDMDRGTLSIEEYWSGVFRAFGVPPTPELISRINREDLLGWTRVNREMVNWSRELRSAGYRTAILSNMSPNRHSFMNSSGQFGWVDEFDVVVYSYRLARVKPEAEIYRVCLDELGVPPEACLFLDDLAVNVAEARALGINAHLFTSAAETAVDLTERWNLPVRSLTGAA
jgi:putative hydrolase of the HAD superfamily